MREFKTVLFTNKCPYIITACDNQEVTDIHMQFYMNAYCSCRNEMLQYWR